MPSFSQVEILPYTSSKLFELILDIEAYPKFLPWCAAAKIISKNNEEIIAELVLQVKGFSEKYQSRIIWEILDNGNYIINVEAISGPFKYLKNTWQLTPHLTATKLEFSIDFKLKLIILEQLMGSYFTKATEKMIIAFEKRAKELLG